MAEPDDQQLLAEFAGNNSETAFAALVQRYVNLVYSVGLRQTGNPHAAEEITQAVFIILARKAKSLGGKAGLSGWLYQTARLTATNHRRTEVRRAHREQEAYMQSTLNESGPDVWPQIAPLLDDALGKLGERDRHAIVLRFFEGKALSEVGMALGASEDAAKMRVNRALEKLRKIFTKRGVTLSATVIAGAVAANSVQAAPAGLAVTISATAVKGTAVAASTLTLAKATLIAMKIKSIIASIAAAVVILGVGTYLATQPKPAQVSTAPSPGDTVPIKFTNDNFISTRTNTDRFLVEVDPATRRTTSSAPAGHIKSLVETKASDSTAWYLTSNPGNGPQLSASSYVFHHITESSSLLGKRIRISGWIKASGVRNWAGGVVLVGNKDHGFAFDDTTSRPVLGTKDWQQIEFVTDIPNESCTVYVAPTLYGDGEIWFDDFQIDIVPTDTPTTDDRNWRFFGANPAEYSVTTDFKNTHEGRSSTCIAYTPSGKAPPSAKLWWGRSIRGAACDKYIGHTVRMTVWTKSENISNTIQPSFHPKDYNGKWLAHEQQLDNHPIRGTTDWTEHITTCRIPKGTEYINTGFNISGSGKIWIDVDSIKFEIIE